MSEGGRRRTGHICHLASCGNEYLYGQLTSWCKNKGCWSSGLAIKLIGTSPAASGVHICHNRQQESACLARPSLGAAHQVPAMESHRDGVGLNGSWFRVSGAMEEPEGGGLVLHRAGLGVGLRL